MLGLALLLAAPLCYLIVAYVLAGQRPNGVEAGSDLAFYVLLLTAFGLPALLWPIERVLVQSFRKAPLELRSQQRGWFTLVVLRLTLVETCFLFGLVIVLITGEFSRIWVFYAIGAVWAIVWWPSRDRIADLLRRVEQS